MSVGAGLSTDQLFRRIKTLLALQIVIGAVAIAALIVGTGARRDAARDSCTLLRGLVHAATSDAPRQRAAARAYIHRTSLRNCGSYATKLVPFDPLDLIP